MAATPIKSDKSRDGAPLLVDLALQGGGAHGAFTWGVLDRLLEEPRLQIEGISGTSAGAMNAAVLISGHAAGGADGAKVSLEQFWRRVSDAALLSPFRRTPLDIMLGRWTLDTSPMFLTLDLMARIFSPYDLNPRGANPLRDILADCIDFRRVAKALTKLFVTATNVHTGRGHVFRNVELTPEVLLASACLPTMFQAIEIDGEAYWDGGYARQSHHHAFDPRMRVERHDPGAGQSGRTARHPPQRARHRQPRQRGFVQRDLAERAPHDGRAAPGFRPRQQRRRPLGRHAHPPYLERHHDRARLFLEAQRRVGFLHHAAQ